MSTNGGELASWKSDQKLSFAMLQAREAVAEVAEDPRNRKAAKLSRANSIMKALDDVGTLGQPMTSWQKRAAATGGLGATQFNQQFASLPRARVNSRPSSGGSGITRGFSQSSGSIGRSDSDERTSIQRSLRVCEEAMRETELDPRNKRPPKLSRKDSVLHAMKHLNISLEDLTDDMPKGPLQRAMSKSMTDMQSVADMVQPERTPSSGSFKQLDKLAKQKMGLWGSMKRVRDASSDSGKRLVGVLSPVTPATPQASSLSMTDQSVMNMLPAALGIFRDVTRVMEAVCATLDGVSRRIDKLGRAVDRLKDEGGGLSAIEASVERLERKLLGGGGGGAVGPGGRRGSIGEGVSMVMLQGLEQRLVAVEKTVAQRQQPWRPQMF